MQATSLCCTRYQHKGLNNIRDFKQDCPLVKQKEKRFQARFRAGGAESRVDEPGSIKALRWYQFQFETSDGE